MPPEKTIAGSKDVGPSSAFGTQSATEEEKAHILAKRPCRKPLFLVPALVKAGLRIKNAFKNRALLK